MSDIEDHIKNMRDEAILAIRADRFARVVTNGQDIAVTQKIIDFVNNELGDASNAAVMAAFCNLLAQNIGMAPPQKDNPDAEDHICMMAAGCHRLIHDMAHHIFDDEKKLKSSPQ